MIDTTGVKGDKRIANAKRDLKAIDKAGGVPERWEGELFKYLGYIEGRPIFAVLGDTVYIVDGELKKAKPSGDLW